MAAATGTVELGVWSAIPGYDILIEPTKKARRFRIVVKPRERPKVRHRKYRGRFLTEGPESGLM
jgi:hypothetical protein